MILLSASPFNTRYERCGKDKPNTGTPDKIRNETHPIATPFLMSRTQPTLKYSLGGHQKELGAFLFRNTHPENTVTYILIR